jgi:hypothetical protein
MAERIECLVCGDRHPDWQLEDDACWECRGAVEPELACPYCDEPATETVPLEEDGDYREHVCGDCAAGFHRAAAVRRRQELEDERGDWEYDQARDRRFTL